MAEIQSMTEAITMLGKALGEELVKGRESTTAVQFQLTAELQRMQQNMQLVAKQLQDLVPETSTALSASLVGRLKTFSGAEDDYHSWEQHMELVFAAMQITDEQKLSLARTCLTGVALQWAQELSSTEQDLTWKKLKEKMSERFVPRNQAFYLRAELKKLRQTGSIQDYIYEFNKLTAKINAAKVGIFEGHLTQVEKMSSFLDGLNAKTRIAMLYKQPTSFEKLVELALAHSQAFDGQTTNGATTNRPEPSSMDLDVLRHSNKEHSNTEEDAEKDEDVEDYLAYLRWKKAKTPHKNQRTTQSTKEKKTHESSLHLRNSAYGKSEKGRSEAKKEATCHRCGAQGHFAAECFTSTEKVKAYHAFLKKKNASMRKENSSINNLQLNELEPSSGGEL
jgi:hypothetical protein